LSPKMPAMSAGGDPRSGRADRSRGVPHRGRVQGRAIAPIAPRSAAQGGRTGTKRPALLAARGPRVG